MIKIRYIARFVISAILFIMAVSIAVATIYTFKDYKYNDYLNVFLGDLTIVFMILMFLISLTFSLFIFFMTFKKVKKQRNSEIL